MKTNSENETTEPEVKPEHIESQIQQVEFATRHQWRQYGNYLRCESCPFPHAVHIGNNLLLVGMDEEGKPIFKTIEILD